MNIFLKLLQAWKSPEGTDYAAGDVIELEAKDKDIASGLVFDGIAEKTTKDAPADDQTKAIKSIVVETVKAAFDEKMKDFDPGALAKKSINIEVKDLSDDDPGSGYLPQRIGDKWTEGEKMFGLGEYAFDVYTASSPSGGVPERLQKQAERSRNVIEKGIKAGYISKASGDLQQVQVDSDGGFLVPPEFNMMLLDQMNEMAVVRPLCSTMTIGSDRVEMPQAKNYDHSSDLIWGGLQAYWKGEDDQLTESKVTFEEVALTLNALTALAKVTHKMMKFSRQSVGSYLLPRMSQAITWKEEDGFINGTGSGMPLGILSAPSKVEVAIESGQSLAGSALVTENILKMFQQVRVERPASLTWLYNRVDAFFWLSTLKLDVGTGGAPTGLVQFMPNSPATTMLGLPLMDNEHCQALGTVGDVILSDLSQYIIADHNSGPEVAQSMHLNFDYGKENFRIMKYVDGQPRYSDTFTRQNATNDSASVVTLATRSN